MPKEKSIINKLKKMNFVKYTLTGIIVTIVSTFLLWFFVDILHLMASVTAIFISPFIFFFQFFLYKKLKMFNDNKSNFIKYMIIWIFLNLLVIFLLWLFVDIIHFRVVIINPIIVIFMFIFRFCLFKWFNTLTKESQKET